MSKLSHSTTYTVFERPDGTRTMCNDLWAKTLARSQDRLIATGLFLNEAETLVFGENYHDDNGAP